MWTYDPLPQTRDALKERGRREEAGECAARRAMRCAAAERLVSCAWRRVFLVSNKQCKIGETMAFFLEEG